MRAKSFIIVAVVILTCLVGWAAYAQTNKAGVTAWEYRVILDPASNSFRNSGSFEKGEAEINRLGAQGWELVAPVHDGSYPMLYFKRPK